ncbi:metallo-beta-lactamase domain protein [Bacteriovorax sp. BAL6_X]|uniref:MBL fold metallo-hydrolase n=1 Tax=Bacteriovorax sp. BAL6_X TaxID=1201290 RepID=UPI000386EB0B|nr:MBL fold metallo-hydrolase [Bacteriovorax sp. BAL6_X]EPZ50716.1 metallo-beta-lactamase domain protein [Bacteriovorax sp. BAL6_X]
MLIHSFFDKDTNTLTYIIYSLETKKAIVVDPVLNFDYASGLVSTKDVLLIDDFLKENNLELSYIFESHVHADHLSGASSLKKYYPGAKIVIHENIKKVQNVFNGAFHSQVKEDGSQFDLLTREGEVFKVADDIEVEIIETPGHTPACMSLYVNKEALFVGDAIFMPDMGTGRCDFPKGSADDLYESIQKIYSLDDNCSIYVGHDYGPGGREIMFKTTVGKQKRNNIQCKASTTKEEFLDFRTSRDAVLSAPRLLIPSIQYNMNGGEFIFSEEDGAPFFKVPVKI